MTTIVRYFYRSYLEGCGCDSNSESWLEFEKDGRVSEEPCHCLIESEEELHECIKQQYPELTDYEIGDDCDYF